MSVLPKKNLIKKVFIVSGDISGDLYNKFLIDILKKEYENIHIWSAGGEAIRRLDIRYLGDLSTKSTVGTFEHIRFFFPKLLAGRHIKEALKKIKPNLLIVIDNPGFSIPLGVYAKKLGIKTLYFVPPHVMVFNKRAAEKIGRIFDYIVPVLSGDADIYRGFSEKVLYFGHPLSTIIEKDVISRNNRFNNKIKNLKQKPKELKIALIPGSRIHEIHRLSPLLKLTAEMLLERYKYEFKKIEFIIPAADIKFYKLLKRYFTTDSYIISLEKAEYIIESCFLSIGSSGTITLISAFLLTPMIISYKTNLLTYIIGRIILEKPVIGLVNIISGKLVFREYIQNNARACILFKEAERIISDDKYRDNIYRDMIELRKKVYFDDTGFKKFLKKILCSTILL